MLVDLLPEVVTPGRVLAPGLGFSKRDETEVLIAVLEEPYGGVFKIEKHWRKIHPLYCSTVVPKNLLY